MICNMCPRHKTCADAKNGCEKCDIGQALKSERKNYLEQKAVCSNLLKEIAPGCEPEAKKKRISFCSDEDIQVEFRSAFTQAFQKVLSKYDNPTWVISGFPIKGSLNQFYCNVDLNKSKKKKLLIDISFRIIKR